MDKGLAHAITNWPGCRQSTFWLHFDRPGCSGPDNSAIRFPGIEGSAGLIGDHLPGAVIAFSFFGVRYFVSNLN